MEKKDIAVVALCGVLLVMWFMRMNTGRPQAPPPNQAVPAEVSPETGKPAANVDQTTTAPKPNNPEPAQITPPTPVGELPADYRDLAPAEPVTLGNPQLSLTVNPNAGTVDRLVLHEFRAGKGDDSAMTIDQARTPVFAVRSADGPLACSPPRVEQSPTDDEVGTLTVSRAVLGRPVVLRQTWSLDAAEPYRLHCRMTFENVGSVAASLPALWLDCGNMPPLNTAKGFMGAGGVDQRIDVLYVDKDAPKTYQVRSVAKQKDKTRQRLAESEIDWLAVQNKYFTTLLDADEPFAGAVLEAIPVAADDPKAPKLVNARVGLPALSLEPGGEPVTLELDCYLGPKVFGRLKTLGSGKEKIMNFDRFLFFRLHLMEYISRFILASLNWLHGLLGSYGIAIIIITLIFRFSFWPVTHQSTVLSRKMKEIQPLAQEIREKYQDDPQRMWQKTSALYRQHRIHPFMAGCLPMLLQIPVFFALFNVLRSAIELRLAGFLWITDLSQPDRICTIPGLGLPVHPLAILWGISMFNMQRLMPTSADPVQQKTMMFMTVFLFFVLYPMPSGLTLYWTVSNLVSIFQYSVTRRMNSGQPAKAAPAPA